MPSASQRKRSQRSKRNFSQKSAGYAAVEKQDNLTSISNVSEPGLNANIGSPQLFDETDGECSQLLQLQPNQQPVHELYKLGGSVRSPLKHVMHQQTDLSGSSVELVAPKKRNRGKRELKPKNAVENTALVKRRGRPPSKMAAYETQIKQKGITTTSAKPEPATSENTAPESLAKKRKKPTKAAVRTCVSPRRRPSVVESRTAKRLSSCRHVPAKRRRNLKSHNVDKQTSLNDVPTTSSEAIKLDKSLHESILPIQYPTQEAELSKMESSLNTQCPSCLQNYSVQAVAQSTETAQCPLHSNTERNQVVIQSNIPVQYPLDCFYQMPTLPEQNSAGLTEQYTQEILDSCLSANGSIRNLSYSEQEPNGSLADHQTASFVAPSLSPDVPTASAEAMQINKTLVESLYPFQNPSNDRTEYDQAMIGSTESTALVKRRGRPPSKMAAYETQIKQKGITTTSAKPEPATSENTAPESLAKKRKKPTKAAVRTCVSPRRRPSVVESRTAKRLSSCRHVPAKRRRNLKSHNVDKQTSLNDVPTTSSEAIKLDKSLHESILPIQYPTQEAELSKMESSLNTQCPSCLQNYSVQAVAQSTEPAQCPLHSNTERNQVVIQSNIPVQYPLDCFYQMPTLPEQNSAGLTEQYTQEILDSCLSANGSIRNLSYSEQEPNGSLADHQTASFVAPSLSPDVPTASAEAMQINKSLVESLYPFQNPSNDRTEYDQAMIGSTESTALVKRRGRPPSKMAAYETQIKQKGITTTSAKPEPATSENTAPESLVKKRKKPTKAAVRTCVSPRRRPSVVESRTTKRLSSCRHVPAKRRRNLKSHNVDKQTSLNDVPTTSSEAIKLDKSLHESILPIQYPTQEAELSKMESSLNTQCPSCLQNYSVQAVAQSTEPAQCPLHSNTERNQVVIQSNIPVQYPLDCFYQMPTLPEQNSAGLTEQYTQEILDSCLSANGSIRNLSYSEQEPNGSLADHQTASFVAPSLSPDVPTASAEAMQINKSLVESLYPFQNPSNDRTEYDQAMIGSTESTALVKRRGRPPSKMAAYETQIKQKGITTTSAKPEPATSENTAPESLAKKRKKPTKAAVRTCVSPRRRPSVVESRTAKRLSSCRHVPAKRRRNLKSHNVDKQTSLNDVPTTSSEAIKLDKSLHESILPIQYSTQEAELSKMESSLNTQCPSCLQNYSVQAVAQSTEPAQCPLHSNTERNQVVIQSNIPVQYPLDCFYQMPTLPEQNSAGLTEQYTQEILDSCLSANGSIRNLSYSEQEPNGSLADHQTASFVAPSLSPDVPTASTEAMQINKSLVESLYPFQNPSNDRTEYDQAMIGSTVAAQCPANFETERKQPEIQSILPAQYPPHFVHQLPPLPEQNSSSSTERNTQQFLNSYPLEARKLSSCCPLNREAGRQTASTTSCPTINPNNAFDESVLPVQYPSHIYVEYDQNIIDSILYDEPANEPAQHPTKFKTERDQTVTQYILPGERPPQFVHKLTPFSKSLTEQCSEERLNAFALEHGPAIENLLLEMERTGYQVPTEFGPTSENTDANNGATLSHSPDLPTDTSTTPSLSESLGEVFGTRNIRDVLNIPAPRKYELEEKHLPAFALMSGLNLQHLRNLLNVIPRLTDEQLEEIESMDDQSSSMTQQDSLN